MASGTPPRTSTQEDHEAQALRQQMGSGAHGVLLHMSPPPHGRGWGGDRWASLAAWLAAEDSIDLGCTGIAEDEVYIERHIKRLPHPPLNLAGLADAPTLVSLFSQCSLLITADASVAKTAHAAQLPTLLLSPDTPRPHQQQGLHIIIEESPGATYINIPVPIVRKAALGILAMSAEA